jgi:hypothetical protein
VTLKTGMDLLTPATVTEVGTLAEMLNKGAFQMRSGDLTLSRFQLIL